MSALQLPARRIERRGAIERRRGTGNVAEAPQQMAAMQMIFRGVGSSCEGAIDSGERRFQAPLQHLRGRQHAEEAGGGGCGGGVVPQFGGGLCASPPPHPFFSGNTPPPCVPPPPPRPPNPTRPPPPPPHIPPR